MKKPYYPDEYPVWLLLWGMIKLKIKGWLR